MKHRLIALTLGLSLSIPLLSHAQTEEAPGLVSQTQNGVSYLSGGIANDQQEAMKAARKSHNLALTFAMRNGDYVADVNVKIHNAKGQEVLQTVSEGPLFYAKLPRGTYKVSAEFDGKTQTRNVTLGGGTRDLGFYW